jgi:hypothetical protein
LKLLSFLESLIVEAARRDKLIDVINYDNNEIVLLSSYHQWFERYGQKTYNEIVDLYLNTSDKHRIGVPDNMIKSVFKENLKTILESHREIPQNENRIIFVKKRKDDDDRMEIFDYIEFILSKDNNKYTIITSAFSKDGNFLRTGQIPKTHKVFVENKQIYNYPVVIL